jgi:glycoside hydrolase family 2 sugar binding
MKQLLQTILLGLSIGVSAGNLYENPGFETWNDSDDLPSSRQWRWGLPKGKQKAFERFARSTKEKFSGTASLHLKDSDSGRSNSSLGFIIGGKEVKRYAGKVLYFSARVKQISASAPGTVGISLFIKDADDKVVTVSAGVDATGQTDWGLLKLKQPLPESTTLIIASLMCANGFGNRGEAFFDDVVLTVDPADVPRSEPAPKALTSNAGTSVPDGAYVSFYPLPPSWKTRIWGGCSWRDKLGTTPYLSLTVGRNAKKYGGFSIFNNFLDRAYDISGIAPERATLKFRMTRNTPVQIRLGRKTVAVSDVTPLKDGWFEYKVPMTAFDGEKTVSNVTVQFPEPPAPGSLNISGLGIYTETAGHARFAPSKEAEEYRDSYRKPLSVTEDGQPRPEIRNGTWYLNGKPYYFLGPWIYNRTSSNWGKGNNPLGIDHIAYQKEPSKEVWKVMGFNSAQISAAHTNGGSALYGLPVSVKYREQENQIREYFNRFGDTPMVLDFAFGFHEAFGADNPAKRKELDQRLGSWHAFIPLCPEHPDGDRYYRDYMAGGVKTALKNRANIYTYELFNESAYGCQCRYNAAEFARRMKRKYGTIQAANKVWGTIFDDFGEVASITNFQQYRKLWPDWCRFSADRYAEILKRYAAMIRTIDRRPNVYFTEQAAGLPPQHTGMDYRRIAEALDVLALEGGWRYGFNSDLTARNEMENVVMSGGSSHWFNCDFYQAAAQGKKPVINNEHYCTRIENGIRVPSRRADMITSLWMELLHGVSANYTYVWDKRAWEARTPEQAKANVINPSYKSSSLLNPYNWPVSELDAFKEFRKEFDPYMERVMPFPRTKPATVAVFYSYPTLRMKPFYTWKFNSRMTAWYGALLHAQFPVRIVFEEDLAAGLGPEVQALIFPAADYTVPETLRHVEAFRKRGGIVIAERNAFRWNEHSEPQPPVNGITRIDADKPEQMLPILIRGGVTRYGTITPADTREPVRMVDLQLIDRGDFKLLFLVTMGDLASRLAEVRLNLNDSGSFYLYDIVGKRILLNGGSAQWTAQDLKRGFRIVLPSQQRVILTLERKRPAGAAEVSQEKIRAEFERLRKLEQPRIRQFRERQAELKKNHADDRVWSGVNTGKCHSVDLRKFANMHFRDEIAGDKKGGWFDQGGNDFANMPLGRRTFAGVPFTIIDPAENGGKGVIILYGKERDYFPKAVSGIPVGRRAARLYMLHTMGWGRDGEKALTYRIRYADGSSLEIPVVGERDISGWWGAKAVPNAKIGVESSNSEKDQVSMQCFRWTNPHPDKVIRAIDILSAQESAVPAIAAITVEEP